MVRTQISYDTILNDSGMLLMATRALRVFGLQPDYWAGRAPLEMDLLNEWALYEATGVITDSFVNQLPAEDAKQFSKIETNIREFMQRSVPNFIKGSKDPFSDDDWNAFVSAVNKYSPETNVEIYQNLLDQLMQ